MPVALRHQCSTGKRIKRLPCADSTMPRFGEPSPGGMCSLARRGLPDLCAGSGVWVYRRGSGGCGCSLVPAPKWRCRPGARVVLWSEPAMRFSHGTRRGSLPRVYRRCSSPVQPFAAWLAELPPDSTAVGFGGGACAWRLARAGEHWRLATWTACWWTFIVAALLPCVVLVRRGLNSRLQSTMIRVYIRRPCTFACAKRSRKRMSAKRSRPALTT